VQTVLLLLVLWVLLSFLIGALWVLGHREQGDSELAAFSGLEGLDKLAS
jgi:hypothetical protein